MLDLFLGFNAGHVGKYIYEGSTTTQENISKQDYLWQDVIHQDNPAYYMPTADNDLIQEALLSIDNLIPRKTSIVDFGIGGIAAFNAHIRPFLEKLSSHSYIGLDFCEDYLLAVKKAVSPSSAFSVTTHEIDFFNPSIKQVTSQPALGIMTCGTIGNMYGTLNDSSVKNNLTQALRTISSLTKNGWLLLSVDTNQKEESLVQGYDTPIMARLFLTVLHRMNKELPVEGFDSSLFKYVPEWHADLQLLAHVAYATDSQDFTLGNHTLHIEKGTRLHLLNSYKFTQDFFESCCDNANLEILSTWHHKSPTKLYLLEDRANPYHLVKEQGMQDLLAALTARDARNAGFGQNFTQAANLIGTRTTHHAHSEARRTSRS
ncbi:MAG: L-histidine N(alpha)-methyltransferase [Bdellovibrionales bacterium]